MSSLSSTKVFVPNVIKKTIAELCEFSNIRCVLIENQSDIEEFDFVLYSENDATEGIQFNIAFIEDIEHQVIMESGGIAIVPKVIEERYTEAHQDDVFQRVLPFSPSYFTVNNSGITIEIDWGKISLPEEQSYLAEHFEGVQLLASQMGIYEDAFYEFFFR